MIEDEIRKVLREYDIDLLNCSVTQLNGQGTNMNFFVEKGQVQKYVLQRISSDIESLNRQLLFLNLLESFDIPVMEVINNRFDEKFVHFNKSLWIMKKYIDGNPCNLNDYEECFMAMNILTRIHSIDYPKELPLYQSIHDPYHWLLDIDKELSNLRDCLPGIDISRIEKNIWSAGCNINVEQYTQFPKAIVHGDFHGKNIIFKDRKLQGIIDFDTIGISARLVDFVEAIFFIGRKNYGQYCFDYKKIYELYKCYLRDNQLTRDEIVKANSILVLRLVPRSEYIIKLGDIEKDRACNYVKWVNKVLDKISSCCDFEKLIS